MVAVTMSPKKPDSQEEKNNLLQPLKTPFLSVSMARTPVKGGWHAAIFIIVVEFAQRFAYYGLAANLITYLTNNLGQPTATAAKNVNTWIGVSNVFPILGAYVADSHLGRFKTILISSLLYLFGMVMLALSIAVVPGEYRAAVFFTALYILAAGEGGHLPCVQTFAADQFEEKTAEEKAEKSSFFNWWYMSIVLAATTAVLLVIYIQDNIGWTQGVSLLAAVLAVAIVLFLAGVKRYRMRSPVGSPIASVVQVFVAAGRKWRVDEAREGRGVCYGDEKQVGEDYGYGYLARTNQLRFLDKAMVMDEQDARSKMRNPWRLCTQKQVEEVKLVVRLVPIWVSCLMFYAVQAQLHTYFTKQGSTMVRTIGPDFQVPPASLQAFVGIVILVTVSAYDRLFVPFARSITGHPGGITMLQRIGFGLFLSVLNMSVSAFVEAKRVDVAARHGLLDSPKATVPMSLWWLLPQYMICSVSDVFTVIGMQELFYDQVPEALRSFGAAAYIGAAGVGSFLSSFIISAVQEVSGRAGTEWLGNNLNRARLDGFYWALAGLSALSLCLYVWMAKLYVYKNTQVYKEDQVVVGSSLSEGHV